jgi:coenzyme F420-reducing hydrogenase alpha subunit
VRRLGFRAYLAVIEVAELAAVKQIHDMTAYLGGILRKPSDEVRPDVTLTRLQYSAVT